MKSLFEVAEEPKETVPDVEVAEVIDAVVDSRSILDMSHDEARAYFLKEESYCNFDLPPYFI